MEVINYHWQWSIYFGPRVSYMHIILLYFFSGRLQIGSITSLWTIVSDCLSVGRSVCRSFVISYEKEASFTSMLPLEHLFFPIFLSNFVPGFLSLSSLDYKKIVMYIYCIYIVGMNIVWIRSWHSTFLCVEWVCSEQYTVLSTYNIYSIYIPSWFRLLCICLNRFPEICFVLICIL